MGTQKLKKVPMGTRGPKWGPTWEQWNYNDEDDDRGDGNGYDGGDDSDALLPRGSPFGDPGPHGDLFQFLGPQKVPIFFQGPHFLYFRLKNALKVGASTTNYMWTILKGEFSETRLVNKNGTNLCTKLSHILWKCFFHYLFPLYFKKLARSDQF